MRAAEGSDETAIKNQQDIGFFPEIRQAKDLTIEILQCEIGCGCV